MNLTVFPGALKDHLEPVPSGEQPSLRAPKGHSLEVAVTLDSHGPKEATRGQSDQEFLKTMSVKQCLINHEW